MSSSSDSIDMTNTATGADLRIVVKNLEMTVLGIWNSYEYDMNMNCSFCFVIAVGISLPAVDTYHGHCLPVQGHLPISEYQSRIAAIPNLGHAKHPTVTIDHQLIYHMRRAPYPIRP